MALPPLALSVIASTGVSIVILARMIYGMGEPPGACPRSWAT